LEISVAGSLSNAVVQEHQPRNEIFILFRFAEKVDKATA
jgi:hypothetical protein